MKELLHHMACSLVDDPSQVSVDQQDGTRISILKLRVAKEDVGKIIGKRGGNAHAIRTVLDACSGKDNKRYILEILESADDWIYLQEKQASNRLWALE